VFYDAARGLWVGQVDLGRDPVTGKRRRPKVSAPTKTECKDKLDELRAERRKTGTVARRDTTVETVVRDWLANMPPQIKAEGTKEIYRNASKRIIAVLGRTKIVRLTDVQVEQYLNGMVRDGMATKTISIHRSVLARSIHRAVRGGLVGRNVAELVPCPRGTHKESRSMTPADVEKLFGSELSPWWRAYLLVGILCGLRPGELLGLRWADVDFDAGVIRLRKSIKRIVDPETGKSSLQSLDLKTERSKRTLQMPRAVARALAALKAQQAAERLKAGKSYRDHGLVFAGTFGCPKWTQDVARTFKKVCVRAGIGSDWHPHEQRHTFVSVLWDAGVDIDRIADAAGHINSNVTKTTYRHVLGDKMTTAAAVMDAVFPKIVSGE